MKYIVVTILALLFTSPVQAENVWFKSKIKMFYPNPNGTLVLLFTGDSTQCTSVGKYHHLLAGQAGVTQEAFNNMYSLALTAATTGKEISVNFDTSSSNCYINRMFVDFSG